MKFFVAAGGSSEETAPRRIGIPFPPPTTAGGTSTVAECAIEPNLHSSTFASHTTGASLFAPIINVKVVLKDSPSTELRADGNKGMSPVISRRRYMPTCYPQVFHSALQGYVILYRQFYAMTGGAPWL